ncbi:MAG: hypothetical protein ACI92G_001683 [Candidatus Pelagisphaera sp.]
MPFLYAGASIGTGKVFDSRDTAGTLSRSITVDNGPEFSGGKLDFSGRLRDEFLNAELFLNLVEVRENLEKWRVEYSISSPRSSRGNRAPADAIASHLEAHVGAVRTIAKPNRKH